jgi:hypothetical protein
MILMDSTNLNSLNQPMQQTLQQGQEKATELAGQLKQGVVSTLTEQKDKVAESLNMVGQGLLEMSNRLQEQGAPIGTYVQSGQQAIDRFSGYLRECEITDLMDDVQSFARQRPALIVGGLFALGFMAGRFLRSSAPPTKALVPYEPPLAYEPTTASELSWR